MGVTDATDGKKITVDLDKLEKIEDVLRWTKASTSIPAIFKAMDVDNKIYIDGGVIENLDVGSAVRRCHELGYTNE